MKIAEEQLTIWVEVIERLFENREQPDFFNQVIEELKKKDKYFSSIGLIDKDTRKKEYYFIGNCIKGIEGYIQKKKM